MKTIDIHAHLVPRSLWQAAGTGREWYGYRHEPGEALRPLLDHPGDLVVHLARQATALRRVEVVAEERCVDGDDLDVDAL